MIRSVFEEAVALASLSLFLATVAVWAQVWAQVLGVSLQRRSGDLARG
jgi:hypothetical protein